MLNCPKFRILSRICPNLTSRCIKRQAVDQNAVDHFDVFACQSCLLLSSKRTKSIFGRGSAPDPAEGAYNAPSDLLVGWGGRCPSPYLSPTRCLRHHDLDILKSVPNFYRRFMVTLVLGSEFLLKQYHLVILNFSVHSVYI